MRGGQGSERGTERDREVSSSEQERRDGNQLEQLPSKWGSHGPVAKRGAHTCERGQARVQQSSPKLEGQRKEMSEAMGQLAYIML